VLWYVTNSVAILTDALESIVNVVAGLIGVYSLYISQADGRGSSYGHGKSGIYICSDRRHINYCCGFIIIYEALNNLVHPHEIKKLDYGILLGAVTGWSIILPTICVKTGKKNNSLALISSGKHLQSDPGQHWVLLSGWSLSWSRT
jgi:divalent metal cation (Fe/Co/Zn/Cd) transporter